MSECNHVAPSGVPAHSLSMLHTAAGPQPAAGIVKVGVSHIEYVQSVQDNSNSVPLVARKATVVRVYLSGVGLAEPLMVTGEIACRRGTGGETFVPALNKVRLVPGPDRPLTEWRSSLQESLNFRLPPEVTTAGTTRIRLSRLQGGADIELDFDAAQGPVSLSFKRGPTLRVKVIGLRYVDGGKTFAPDAVHFSYMRSWLGRAYPVATVEWSQLVVDADFAPPFNEEDTPVLANAQVAALRSRDVSGGVDARTHYYGLVSDANGRNFMRGLAFDIPAAANPGVVASGPAGKPAGFNGDFDLSYADWYGAHELAHTFGRYHPGFPGPDQPGGQDASDPQFPYPDGRISGEEDGYIGLDVGDADLALPMQVMPGHTCHDVMTYRENQWVSAYTFKAILARLIMEDEI